MSEAVGLKELLRRRIEAAYSDEGDKHRSVRANADDYSSGPVYHLSSDAPTPLRTTAQGLLSKARDHMLDRAATYDKPEGERSMRRAVEAFNAITGRDLEESEGWLLLQVLKDVRDRQRREPHVDSLEDCIAYAALKAEARLAGK